MTSITLIQKTDEDNTRKERKREREKEREKERKKERQTMTEQSLINLYAKIFNKLLSNQIQECLKKLYTITK